MTIKNGLRSEPAGGPASPPYSQERYSWDTQLHLTGKPLRNATGRYKLEEYFSHTPGLNADLASGTEATRVPRNRHFEVLGTNMTSALATWSTTRGALLLTTAGADNDQGILLPHLDTKQTAWTGVLWGTENQIVWETSIRVPTITTVLVWAGLKLTNDPTVATDDDQCYFRFSTDDSDTNWEVVYSIGGTDTTADSGVAVAAATQYNLRIEIDSSRIPHFFINDVEVAVGTALTNDVDLIPYVGVQALSTAALSVEVAYQKISRLIFE